MLIYVTSVRLSNGDLRDTTRCLLNTDAIVTAKPFTYANIHDVTAIDLGDDNLHVLESLDTLYMLYRGELM